jgi:hypothetical protein
VGLILPRIVYDNAGSREMPHVAGNKDEIVNPCSCGNEKIRRIARAALHAEPARKPALNRRSLNPAPRYFFERSIKPASVGSGVTFGAGLARISKRSGWRHWAQLHLTYPPLHVEWRA